MRGLPVPTSICTDPAYGQGAHRDKPLRWLPATGFIVLAILYLPHDVYAVGNHDENDTHVLSESQQQVAEILGLDGRAFGIKFVYTYQSPDDACHILAIDLLHFQSGASAAAHGVVQHEPRIEARFIPISSATMTAVCISLMTGFKPNISRWIRLFCIVLTRCVFSFLQSPFWRVSPESCNSLR